MPVRFRAGLLNYDSDPLRRLYNTTGGVGGRRDLGYPMLTGGGQFRRVLRKRAATAELANEQ